jgi:hypothetical protein
LEYTKSTLPTRPEAKLTERKQKNDLFQVTSRSFWLIEEIVKTDNFFQMPAVIELFGWKKIDGSDRTRINPTVKV